MKKKGLIISTIVMVVVLIASLTTATYAWFTSTATATISSMNIQTSAAEGLQIAAVKYNVSGAPTTYNGALTLDDDTNGDGSYKWLGAEENGYGSDLTLEPAAGQFLLSAMYGASGNGINLFKQTDSSKLPSAANPMAAAAENINYVALDFSLMATSAGEAYINQIYVNPGAFGAKSGMAGSMRIALFATAPGAPLESGSPTWTIASNGKMLYIPYGLTYTGVLFSATPETNEYYTAAGVASTSVGTKSGESLQETWTAAKTVYGTKTATSGKTLAAVGNSTPYANKAEADAVLVNQVTPTAGSVATLGNMTANQVIYLRLVIWFEGESKACIQEFSGGGAQVTINFSLETA